MGVTFDLLRGKCEGRKKTSVEKYSTMESSRKFHFIPLISNLRPKRLVPQ